MAAPLTPQSTLGSPIELSPQSPASTLVNSSPRPAEKDQETTTALSPLEIYDKLLKDLPPGSGLIVPTIVALGSQSAGKSSLLSAIGGFDLFCAGKTATHGPTQIHSRQNSQHLFRATISIRCGDESDFVFTRKALNNPDELVRALQWAGDEARRGTSPLIRMRTYEQLLSNSEAHRTDQQGLWEKFTENLVILNISGAAMIDVSIIDLPGLVGDHLVHGIAECHIRKPDNLILLCIAGIGADPSPDVPEMRLVQKHDPEGRRTIGVFTKVDLIDNFEENETIDIILDRPGKEVWRLRHQWWPFRGKTPTEYKRRVSTGQYLLAQSQMFQNDDWRGVEERASRKFGVEPLKAKLQDMFGVLVNEALRKARLKVTETVLAISAELSSYPAEIDQPVREVQAGIINIAAKLRQKISTQRQYTGRLLKLQMQLEADLLRSLPEFMPFCEADVERSELYSAPVFPNWPTSEQMSGDVVYVDAVYEDLDLHTHRRSDTTDYHAVRMQYMRKYTSKWTAICAGHSDSVGQVLVEAIDDTLSDTCSRQPGLKQTARRILIDSFEASQKATAQRISWLCIREIEDPCELDLPNRFAKSLVDRQFDVYMQGLVDLYGAPPASTTSACCAPPTLDQDESSIGPRDWCIDHRRRACKMMGQVAVFLVNGSHRLTDIVGRETQYSAIAFLDQVIPTLQVGLDLDQVVVCTEKRAREMVEPDAGVVKKRQACAKKLQRFETYRSMLDQR